MGTSGLDRVSSPDPGTLSARPDRATGNTAKDWESLSHWQKVVPFGREVGPVMLGYAALFKGQQQIILAGIRFGHNTPACSPQLAGLRLGKAD